MAWGKSSTMLRPRLPRLAFSLRRRIHRVPPLDHFRNGIPGLFTPEGFRLAYTDYQSLMLEKLNALTAGSADDYSSTPKNLLIKYARQPNMASLFNHASMAHNNHFFFSCLSTEKTVIPPSFRKALEKSFSSIETLRSDFIATANAMFGPGFVWLVRTMGEQEYALLTTYIAGSPYPGAHWRRQSRDLNTEPEIRSQADYARVEALRNLPISNTVGAHGPLSAAGKMAPGGVDAIPILCVNTWQYVYLADWGIMQKKQYLEAWWERIDWNVVANNAGEKSQPTKFMY